MKVLSVCVAAVLAGTTVQAEGLIPESDAIGYMGGVSYGYLWNHDTVNPVVGGKGAVLFPTNHGQWMIGGAGFGAPNDDYVLGYGGLMLGHDWRLSSPVSIHTSAVLGRGGLIVDDENETLLMGELTGGINLRVTDFFMVTPTVSWLGIADSDKPELTDFTGSSYKAAVELSFGSYLL